MGGVTADLGRGLSAEAMAVAVAGDPQFRLPLRPRLVPGLVLLPLTGPAQTDGLLVEGTGTRQVLRGRAATTLVPRLLPALDGTRTVAEVARYAGTSVRTAHACLALLYACGVLDDAAVEPAAAGAAAAVEPATAQYLGRLLDTTRVNRSVPEAVARLRGATVGVLGPAALTAPLDAELRAAGLDMTDPVAAGPAANGPMAADLLVVVDGGDAATMRLVDAERARQGQPWLRVALHGDHAHVGPLFDARYTACYDCFAAGLTPPPGAGHSTEAQRAAWAGLVATEVVYALARVGRSVSTSGCLEYDLTGFEQRLVGAYRRPGCRRCCPLPGQAAVPAPPAHAYEQAVAFPPREWLNPKDHQHHYRPANLALQRESKHYPAAPRLALPAPGPVGAPPDGPGLDVLAGLLARSAGLRGEATTAGVAVPPGKVQRWAPTGGNLGSPQAYLLAVDIAGLAPGCYFYQPDDHSLARLRAWDRAAAARAARRALPADPTAPEPLAVLVLTAALRRVANKYHDFAYRICVLDAGAALAQLTAVAGGYGLTARPAARWDDHHLAHLLGLDAAAEPVTVVVGLGRPA